jgi:tRNA dimethylallyltransferase
MYTRINQRVDIMMQHGLLTEAKVMPIRIECPANCWLSRIVQLSQRRIQLTICCRRNQNTRRFAKRQITWFKEIKLRNGTILKRHIKQL